MASQAPNVKTSQQGSPKAGSGSSSYASGSKRGSRVNPSNLEEPKMTWGDVFDKFKSTVVGVWHGFEIMGPCEWDEEGGSGEGAESGSDDSLDQAKDGNAAANGKKSGDATANGKKKSTAK